MKIVKSKNQVPLRFPYERWTHIIKNHPKLINYFHEILATIENPKAIHQGNQGELLAIKEIEKEKFLVVAYKEIDSYDGFILTAYLVRKLARLSNKKKVWP